MNEQGIFTSGSDEFVPYGDEARQAIHSLRGYTYQVLAAALAWLDLTEHGRLYLEVAEDYAVVAQEVVNAVQVKDTQASGNVTLNTHSIRQAILDYIALREKNPEADIQLRYFTTSEIGLEQNLEDRPAGMAGLRYWRKAAASADIQPLRSILEGEKFSSKIQTFVRDRNDEQLRKELLRKIHWECGQPEFSNLRMEFETRLIVLGRTIFQIPAPEIERIADILIYRVLEKSITKNTADRVLTRADLFKAIDSASRVSVPRPLVDLAMSSSNVIANGFSGIGTRGLPVTTTEPSWLIEGRELPPTNGTLSRENIKSEIAEKVRQFGVSVITGTSGVGKSLLAHSVAREISPEFLIVEFRGADSNETKSRLNALVSRIGDKRGSVVILEDLNCFNEPYIRSSLSLAFDAMRRRDYSVIVTCYVSPTVRALTQAGLDGDCSLNCPYFTEEETKELVSVYGGDPERWGPLAYLSSAAGHPQLVHAYVAGEKLRGWPASDIRETLDHAFSSEQVEEEREAARRSLVSVFPENTRNLLYRLSLTIGRFDRSMALAIANVPPSISQAGECLDELIGPWLETLGGNIYRVSPLAGRFGQEMLMPEQQGVIHNQIAEQFLADNTVNGGELDLIVTHALLGKNEGVLARISISIISADKSTLEQLAENLTAFKLLRTDSPIYSSNHIVSILLRIAQFKILVTRRERGAINDCATALISETESSRKDEMGETLTAAALGTILITLGIGDYLDNWMCLLKEYQTLINSNKFLRELRDSFQKETKNFNNFLGGLFAIGSASLSSVARLEDIIDELDQLEASDRTLYLSTVSEISSDYSAFINNSWINEHKTQSFDAGEAAERFGRMAIKTEGWGVRELAIQCWIAQSVMYNEYIGEKEKAFNVLNEAERRFGNDIRISRARAKIYWLAQDHERALSILRGIADDIGLDNYIERAFTLRDAAISAAKCGEWEQAKTWFIESKEVAVRLEDPGMNIMAIGLGADAAVAAIHCGQFDVALSKLHDALIELRDIDSTSSVRACYCHHVLRHTVLWTQIQLDKNKAASFEETIYMEPGCCSNPEPSSEIFERPLGEIDIAWYSLAECEVVSRTNVGITDKLYSLLSGDTIPIMEIGLHERLLERDIVDVNSTGFVQHIWGHVEALAYLAEQREQLVASFNPLQPDRGRIPTQPYSSLSRPEISTLADEAVTTFCIAATCTYSVETLSRLEACLKEQFGRNIPGDTLFARLNADTTVPKASNASEAVIDAIRNFKNDIHITPYNHCVAGIRFYLFAKASNFKRTLIPIIASWQRDEWKRIITSERFRLLQPTRTVPSLEQALTLEADSQFLSTLFLATINATGVSVAQEVIANFEESAESS